MQRSSSEACLQGEKKIAIEVPFSLTLMNRMGLPIN
jgi:hypothetical protein